MRIATNETAGTNGTDERPEVRGIEFEKHPAGWRAVCTACGRAWLWPHRELSIAASLALLNHTASHDAE